MILILMLKLYSGASMFVDSVKLYTVSMIREFAGSGLIHELFCHVFYLEEL